MLKDYNIVLMLERGMRGGVSQCCRRYVKANNKHVKGYDRIRESNYLVYMNANNLYGWTMSQLLPTDGFRVEEFLECSGRRPQGYILEVGLRYLTELHDEHSDLPLAPQNRAPPESQQTKLLTTLYDKERYVPHYWNLKQ